jgi:SAM-dependent methyltransferase
MITNYRKDNMPSQWKQNALFTLRSLGILGQIERIYRTWSIAGGDQDNARFCSEHPDFVAPPKAAMHDAYGTISFRSYWQSGQHFARIIADLILSHHKAPRRVLEWGCGPARIIRHLPSLLPDGALMFGADYNKESVAWCAANLPNITFIQNELAPPLPFKHGYFDVIYAVSVFTHLSVDRQKAWADELRRLLAAGGILIFTTNGERAAHLLLPVERASFDREGAVIRGQVKEGTRCFLSYNSPEHVRGELFSDLEVCSHMPGYPGAPGTEQDIWVLRAG